MAGHRSLVPGKHDVIPRTLDLQRQVPGLRRRGGILWITVTCPGLAIASIGPDYRVLLLGALRLGPSSLLEIGLALFGLSNGEGSRCRLPATRWDRHELCVLAAHALQLHLPRLCLDRLSLLPQLLHPLLLLPPFLLALLDEQLV